MATLRKKELQQHARRIEELVRALDSAADLNLRATAKELVQVLMDLQGASLERILEIVHEDGEAGATLIQTFERDELVKYLLLLHGLHSLDLQTRVMKALDKSRHYLQSQGGDVELIGVDDYGVVRLRLSAASSKGCGSSSGALKKAIEEAIYEEAPDIASLVVEGAEERVAGFVPLAQLSPNILKPELGGEGSGDVTALPLANVQASGS
jgi:Fe-S cluster biogenesis protein NfuA